MLSLTQEPMLVQLPRVSWTESIASCQLEKPIATATLKYDIGDNSFAEHFVVMKVLTGPITGIHFMRHNSVVIDTTHGLFLFPHSTMQAKNAAIETSAKPQTCPNSWQHNSTANDNKNNYSICWPPIGRAYNRYCKTSGKIYRSSESANIILNLNNNWQKTAVRISKTTESA